MSPQAIPDQEKTVRFRAFWQRQETDRPLIGATIATFPSVRAVRREAGRVQPDDLDIEENLKELDEEWEQWQGSMGDALWSANPLWAFPWHLAIAGCPIVRDADNLWALPVIDDWRQLESLQFDQGNPWFQRLSQFVQALLQHGAGRYPVGLGQLMLGPVDMMMQTRGQERLALDLYDSPEMVIRLGARCVDLCASVTEALYSMVPPYLGGRPGTIRYFWAPGDIVETAEDIGFMMSPEAHRRFVLPLHRALGQRFPFTIVHLHSAQLHTVPNLLEVNEIAAIQITPDFGEDMVPRIPLMAQILEHKPLIVHGVMTINAIREMMKSLPAKGLALFCRCETPAEARKVLEAVL